MISTTLAAELRAAGLAWEPISGDAFQIDTDDFEGDTFHVSDMTIEPHRYATGTVLGFNGTTEWALDSVALDDALWLPREDQLRELLGEAFLRLERIAGTHGEGRGTFYRVDALVASAERSFESDEAEEALGLALLEQLRSSPRAAR